MNATAPGARRSEASHDVESERVTASIVLLWMRSDRARQDGMEYWRGPHSQLVARSPGFREYRQHHFDAAAPGLWPSVDGVETEIPDERRIDGTPEVTLDGPIGALKALKPNKLVQQDEANVFGRTILHATALNAGRWFTCLTPAVTGARTVVLLRQQPGSEKAAFAALLNKDLGPTLAALPGVTEVRTYPFSPHKASSWNTPGVAHDYPDEQQFHGSLVIGATDHGALEAALRAAQVTALSETISKACSALHAYVVTATYTNTQNGRVTLPQVKPESKPPLDPVKRIVPAAPPLPEPTREFPQATLIPLPGHGAEDVVVGADGHLYCGVEGGAIVKIDAVSGAATVVTNTGGRPLGLEAQPDGQLLVCDAHRGLLRVSPSTGAVETLTQYVHDVPLRFCSNAASTPDGAIWFTESTTRFDFEHFMGSFLEHRPSGRLLRRDTDGSVAVVLDDLYFANGLTLTPDKSALILAETSGYRLSRIDVSGPLGGKRQDLVPNLPGFPDNISTFTDGRAWVAMTGPRSAALDKLATAPGAVRKIVWRLPDKASGSTVWCRAIAADGLVLADLRTERADFHTVTGVAELDGRVWLASATHSALLRLDLEGIR